MEKILEKVCFNFRKFLSIIIAFIGIHAAAQNTGQPPRQVTFTINGQVGTNQTIVFDSTANAWAIESDVNKHILKVPGIRLVTASGTTNYVPKFSLSNALINSQISDNGSTVNVANRLSVGLNSSVPGDASFYPLLIRASVPTAVSAAMQNTDSTGFTAFRLFNSNAVRVGSFGVGNPGTSAPFKNNMYLTTQTAFANLVLATQNVDRLRITPDGNIGIGNIAATSKLEVNGTGRFYQDVTFDANALIATPPTLSNHAVNKAYSDAKLDSSGVRGSTGYIPKFTATRQIRNSLMYETGGNVGVGTTLPLSRFQIVETTSGVNGMTAGSPTGVSFSVSNNNRLYGMHFGVYANGMSWIQAARIDGTATSYNLSLQAAGGNVGIGNTAPASKLDVSGTGNFSSDLTVLGGIGLGGTTGAGQSLRIGKSMTGSSTAYGVLNFGVIQPDVTNASYFYSTASVAAGANVSTLFHYVANQNPFVGTVANQYGFVAASGLTGAGFNFAFLGGIPSGTGRFNLYMNGTADNVLMGNTAIGSLAASATHKLEVTGTAHITGSTTFDSNVLIATAPSAGSHATNKTYVDTKQPGDGDLTAIAALSGTGFPKRTGTDTWSVGALAISDITSLQTTLDTKADTSALRGTAGNIPVFTATRQIRNSTITDNGTNVGISNASPFAKFSITASNGSAIIGLQRTNYGPGVAIGAYGFANESNNFVTAVTSNYIGSDNTQGYISFRSGTANSSPHSLTERMRVNHLGNVTIPGAMTIGSISNPDASALLDLTSTTKGLGLPQMTTSEVNAISTPKEGLTVYNTTLHKICYYNGTTWKQVTDSNM